jgi:hypothetical protein
MTITLYMTVLTKETKNLETRVETDPALAYAVRILQEINPALREFEDSENMINHYNKLKETSIIANRLCFFQIVMCLTDES